METAVLTVITPCHFWTRSCLCFRNLIWILLQGDSTHTIITDQWIL